MRKASIIMAGLACAMIAAAYTNSVPISTNTRAATEKWTAIRFEPALPPTPENAASKFLAGNREWQTVTAAQIGALTNETDAAALAALAAYAAYWPKNATASSWFTYTTNSGAITITGYNIAGGTDVVIPDYINGWPVTAIGVNAFRESGVTSIGGAGNVVMVGAYAFNGCSSLASVSLPHVQTVGNNAFESCHSLTSVSLPHVQTFGSNAFGFCGSLASVSLPQMQTVGDGAFSYCTSLTSVSSPQTQTVGEYAFAGCGSLASVYFDDAAPTIGEGIFAGITLNQVTNYVTNPTATGWGATFGGMPVVRLPLYADAITLNGDTITEWPSSGGGETSIIAPLYESGTNVTVTSTQSVYSVAVTGAGPVGIDWSGLALDGTGRAEVTLRLNVTEWGGTNVTFSPSLTFDRTPEILVTGVWEFAASTVDGVATRVRQTWPECYAWTHMVRMAGLADVVGTWVGFSGGPATNYVYFNLPNTGLHYVRVRPVAAANGLTGTFWLMPLHQGNAARDVSTAVATNSFTSVSSGTSLPLRAVMDGVSGVGVVGVFEPSPYAIYLRYRDALHRPLNALERAAYEAGWRP